MHIALQFFKILRFYLSVIHLSYVFCRSTERRKNIVLLQFISYLSTRLDSIYLHSIFILFINIPINVIDLLQPKSYRQKKCVWMKRIICIVKSPYRLIDIKQIKIHILFKLIPICDSDNNNTLNMHAQAPNSAHRQIWIQKRKKNIYIFYLLLVVWVDNTLLAFCYHPNDTLCISMW